MSTNGERYGPGHLANRRDFIGNEWSTDLPTSSMAMYTDRSIDNVFGLVAKVGTVSFLPHADGSPNHPYRVMSDYRTLEDLVCWRLKDVLGGSSADSSCGVPDVED